MHGNQQPSWHQLKLCPSQISQFLQIISLSIQWIGWSIISWIKRTEINNGLGRHFDDPHHSSRMDNMEWAMPQNLPFKSSDDSDHLITGIQMQEYSTNNLHLTRNFEIRWPWYAQVIHGIAHTLVTRTQLGRAINGVSCQKCNSRSRINF